MSRVARVQQPAQGLALAKLREFTDSCAGVSRHDRWPVLLCAPDPRDAGRSGTRGGPGLRSGPAALHGAAATGHRICTVATAPRDTARAAGAVPTPRSPVPLSRLRAQAVTGLGQAGICTALAGICWAAAADRRMIDKNVGAAGVPGQGFRLRLVSDPAHRFQPASGACVQSHEGRFRRTPGMRGGACAAA